MSGRTPTQVLAQTLKRLYPQNPDIVLGREARIILEAFKDAGYAVVLTGCLHDFDPECARCRTLRHFQPEPTWAQDHNGEWNER